MAVQVDYPSYYAKGEEHCPKCDPVNVYDMTPDDDRLGPPAEEVKTDATPEYIERTCQNCEYTWKVRTAEMSRKPQKKTSKGG